MIAGVQIRGLIVKFQSLVRYATMLVASALVVACGGGAQTDPNAGGTLSVAPTEGTFYAGTPGTITISGGRMPYSLTSSEPSVLPVPAQVSSHSIQLVGNNPGVIDTGLPPNSLPIRTVNITVRDNDAGGDAITIKIHVAQNFLLGYGTAFKSNCPSSTSACAGAQVAVGLADVTNGVLGGGRLLRFIVLTGPFKWVFPTGGTGTSVDLMTDHTGFVTAIMQVDTGVPTQLGVFRVQDVATGVYEDEVFTISGTVTPSSLTILPSTFDFAGVLKGTCGTGSGDFLVFDGQPPYKAISSDPGVSVTANSTTQPGRFTLNAGNPNTPCLSGATIVVTDANLGRGTVTVKTEEGSGSPPPPALSISPNGLTLTCGQQASVTIVGGASTSYSASSTDSNLTLAPSGNTLSIKRNGALPVLPGGTQVSTVNVTDGTTIVPVSVTVPVNCT
jgi:hypothetical protein